MAVELRTEEFWRDWAKKAREMAASMRDPETRRIMLGIARSYERLAELASIKP
jgi:hypothetical protein